MDLEGAGGDRAPSGPGLGGGRLTGGGAGGAREGSARGVPGLEREREAAER